MGRALVLCLMMVPSGALAEGDPVAGEAAFRQCRACHEVGEGAANRTGPHLNAVVNRAAGSVEDYRYSPAMAESGLVWDAGTLERFLADPRGTVPGTRMSFRGVRDAAERADLVAYLGTLGSGDGAEAAGLAPEAETILALAGDAGYGEYLASECTACHAGGDQGTPRITNLPRGAFVSALLDYRTGRRSHQVMEMVASRLGDEEIAALAAHFSEAR